MYCDCTKREELQLQAQIPTNFFLRSVQGVSDKVQKYHFFGKKRNFFEYTLFSCQLSCGNLSSIHYDLNGDIDKANPTKNLRSRIMRQLL